MLKKKYRLPAAIRLKKARKISSRYFFLNTGESGLSYSRFAFVVSKRVDKRAVIRNKIKRKVTEAINGQLERIKAGIDMIFIFRKEAGLDISETCEAVMEVLEKEGFLN